MVADHRNHVWTYDFVNDVDETGRKLRFLTVEDEFTREAVAIEAGIDSNRGGMVIRSSQPYACHLLHNVHQLIDGDSFS